MEGDYMRLHKGTGQGYVLLGEGARRVRRHCGAFFDGPNVNPRALERARPDANGAGQT